MAANVPGLELAPMGKEPGSLTYDTGKDTDLDHVEHKSHDLDGLDVTVPPELDAIRSAWDDLSFKQSLRLFWRGVLVCFLAGFSSFTDGYQIAIVGNIIGFEGFIKQFGTDINPETGGPMLAADVLSAWTAVGSVMQWCGMTLFPFIADKFGRKWCMISYWIIIAAGVAAECGAREWRAWLAAKMFVGLGVGAMQFCMQVYITEMSPTAKVRGAMLSLYNFWQVSSPPTWVTGMFIGTITITMLRNHDQNNWLKVIYSEWSQVGIMGIIYVFCLPESTWWYARQDKHDKGIKSLHRLYHKIPGYDAEVEYAIIRRTVEHERAFAIANKEVSYMSILKGVNGWRTFVASYELLTATFVGQSFLSTYVVLFFEIAGSTNAFTNTCITSGLGIACTVFLILFLDKFGRRRIICYGISTMWLSLFLIGCIGLVKNPSKSLNGLLIFLACLWTVCFNIGNGAGWAMIGEVPSSRLRAKTAGFAASIPVAFGIGIGYGTPYMISTTDLNWGLKTCFFFAGVSFPLVVGLWFIIPEVKGRSAAELDEMFELKVKPWRFRKYVTEVERTRTAKGNDEQVAAGAQAA
ncbi:hypothetical protein I316_07485 [Kwoniella heveanensis BCC8398]|uniref:Major facilitator superfamily (MFS) profile domain-containing protein n=1 Tax=Kwoniella heveanensis BCC8398 TaxID=1296120 RepID=A0A1B9GIF2_9TREE|nr:hypothetical protein I316_07485 [Kwoniella heveanensis BCC8398]